jgi:hypothetical protein
MIDSGNALSMLQKWADEETKLLFRLGSADAASAIGGTISSASPDDCVVKSVKGDATLRFRINDPDCRFEFTDRRSLASSEPSEGKGDLSTLLIFFPARFSLEEIRLPKEGTRMSLTISELDESEFKE